MDHTATGTPAAQTPSSSGIATEDGMTVLAHMTAGGAAGIAEHVAMYPVDTVKTRMQAHGHPGQQLHRSTVWRALRVVVRREGAAGLYKGVGAVAAMAGPAHALHFAMYEYCRKLLGSVKHEHSPAATALAASIATVVNDGCMTPADVVKQRLQVAHSPYTGIWDCITRTLRTEGVGAFFKSYSTTLVMNIPFAAVHFSVYESGKVFLQNISGAEEDTLLTQLVAGGAAGGSAAALTTPLDVVKTRMQTDGVHSRPRYSSSVLATLRTIAEEEGSGTLWRGIKPRVLFHVPAAAVCWGTYESMKSMLLEEE